MNSGMNNRLTRLTQLLLVFIAFALFYRGWPTSDPLPKDFAVFSIALERFRQGLSPYDAHIVMTYKYSPGFFSILHALWPPISDSSSHIAWWCFKAFSLVLWLCTMILCFPVHNRKNFLALLIGLAFCWKGLIETLDFGQLEYVLFSLTFFAAYWESRSLFFTVIAGILAGLLPWIKLPFALVPVILFLHSQSKKRFSSGVFISAIFMGVILPVFTFGNRFFSIYCDWFEALKNQSAEILIQEPANQSLLATLSRSGVPPLFATLICAALIAIFLIHEWSLVRKKANSRDELPTRILTLLLLVNPLSWRWAGLFLIGVPGILMQKSRGFLFTLSLLLFFLWLIQLNPISKFLGFARWTDLYPYGVITLTWILCLITIWRPSEKN